MASPRPQRQSWKRPAAESPATTGTTRASRWTFTLLAATLTVLLVAVIWWLVLRRADRTHFVAIIAGDHAKLSVPALPFAQHDLQPLRDRPHRHLEYLDWSHLLEADQIGQLAGDLQQLKLGQRDTLIVYVSAHGISNLLGDQHALLLCRDFDLNQPRPASVAVDDLLAAVQASAAQRKLLILDTGYLPADPRLGMLVNEFSRQVRLAVQRLPESDFWVLLSCDVLQCNTLLGDQTAFGQSVVDGLLGAANANDDPRVDLAELFQYVGTRCRELSGGLQTVRLLHAGSASVDLPGPQPVHMATIDPRAAAPEPSPAEPTSATAEPAAEAPPATATRLAAQVAADPAPAADGVEDAPAAATPAPAAATPGPAAAPPAEPAAATTEEPAAAATTATPAGTPAAPPTADPGQDETARLRAALDEAWRLREQFQAWQGEPVAWLPLEYSPHLWRELNRLLLDSESWLLSGPNPSLALQIDKQVEGLQTLAREATLGAPYRVEAVGDLVTDRLRRAQAEFLASPARQQFATATDPLQQVARELRRFRRLLYLLPEYVRWYGLATFVAPDDDDQLDNVLAEPIERLLADSVQLQDEIRQYRDRPLPRDLPARIQDEVDQLLQRQQQLAQRLDGRIAEALARPEIPAFRRQLAVFLQTSLPTLQQRQQIRAPLQTAAARASEPSGETGAMAIPAAGSLSQRQWQRVIRRWRMQEGLLRLAAPQFSLGPPPALFQDSEEVWGPLRQAGTRLREAYVQLETSTGPFAGQSRADCLQLVDGRDAPAVPDPAGAFPQLGFLPPLVPPSLHVAWSAGAELPLLEAWRDVTLTLKTTAPSSLEVSLAFQFDESAVELQTASGQTVRPGSYPATNLQNARDLALRIRALKVVTDPAETTLRELTVAAQAPNLSDQAVLRCLLPRPDEVALVATRVGSNEPELSFAGPQQMLQLRAYPNRTTHFRLQLRNLSGLPKSVQVRLLAIPSLNQATWPPGRILAPDQKPYTSIVRGLFEPGEQQLLPGVQVLAQTSAPLVLPDDGRAVDLPLNRPAASPPADPAAAAAPGATPPPAPPPVDISAGLLCVIEDSETRWLKWIELQPIPPRDYLKVDVAYDLQRLSIDMRARGVERLPWGVEQQPIGVVWEIDRLIEEQLRVGDRVETGTLASANDRVQLYADVAVSRDRQASVRLAADRYPRAFIFELPLDRRIEQDDPRRDLPELVIQSVAISSFPRVYVTSEAERRRLIAQRSSDDQRPVVVLQPGRVAAFPKPDVGDQMEIRLRADAPVSAFGRSDANDRITVQLRDRLGGLTFEESRYADRQANFYLDGLTDGRIGIASILDDHRLVTRPQRMEGEYQLLATMTAGADELRYPRIPVVFDGQPPRVLRPLAASPTRVDVGKPLDVSFEVSDESGLAKVEIGLVKTLADPLDDKKKVVLEWPSGPLVRARLTSEEPGEFWIKAVVQDGVDHTTATQPGSEFPPLRVQVMPPADASASTDNRQVVGRVTGVTQIGSRKVDRISVKLSGDKEFPPVVTKNGGEFEFADVPAGKYELTAEGYWNGERIGKLPIELKQLSDYRPFVIQLQAKPRDK